MTRKENKTDLGTLRINNEVVASIARSAALEVNGVEGIRAGALAMITEIFSKGYHHRGISLEILEGEIKVGVTIIVRYGVKIPDVAAAVQENIRKAVEEMTGLTVVEVNVSVGDLHVETKENSK